MFSSVLFIIHDVNGVPYGTAQDIEEAESILAEREAKCGLKG